IDSAECGTEAPVCAEVDFESVCVAECPDSDCTGDYLCEGGLCVPPGEDVGGACSASAECRSGICAGTVCTRICETAAGCPDGFECRPAGEASGCFVPVPVARGDSGGCAATGAPAPSSWPIFGSLVLLVALVRRRRG
ncbi:MAG: hypothetical protein JRH11_26615, partial [Deltaproteobacteria bacterium]|nr:hypothetical protein [Deltaproteobacteria bacterium]